MAMTIETKLLDAIAEKQANGWVYGTHPRDKARIALEAIMPIIDTYVLDSCAQSYCDGLEQGESNKEYRQEKDRRALTRAIAAIDALLAVRPEGVIYNTMGQVVAWRELREANDELKTMMEKTNG